MIPILHVIDGHNLLENLLAVSDENGRIVLDNTTYLPDLMHYWNDWSMRYSVQRIHSLMKVYGINPLLDKDFINEGNVNFLMCFISKKMPKTRKDLLHKHLNKNFKLINSDFSVMVSNRKARFESFIWFFKFRKKLYDLWYSPYERNELGNSEVKWVCQASTDILFGKKIKPACSFLDKAMLLLMGDYVDKKYEDNDLIRNYGYPGAISENANSEHALNNKYNE